jgi:central glycolytic genes regulator
MIRRDTNSPCQGEIFLSDLIDILKRFTPEIIDLLERRYNILRTISYAQPVGRRLLAEQLSLGERVVRGEIDFLKGQQLLLSDAAGVRLTPECELLIPELASLVHKLRGLIPLEVYLAEKMGLDRVHIVPGDIDQDPKVLKELGKLAGRFIRDVVQDDWVIAVTGGTTMSEVAHHIPPMVPAKNRVLVVPARGGLGEQVEIQANTIAAGIAQRLGASYRLLHVPDNLHGDKMENLLTDVRVQEIISLNKGANLLIHGIGVPEEMAQRRGIDWQELLRQAPQLPVGEAFGYYFAEDGSVVGATPTVGPKLEDLVKLNMVMAVAGGKSKAQAIMAVVKRGFIDVLITDQGAAEAMQQHLAEAGSQFPAV